MKFLADECCDSGLVASLRDDGHDVAYVIEGKTGISDDDVLQGSATKKLSENGKHIDRRVFLPYYLHAIRQSGNRGGCLWTRN